MAFANRREILVSGSLLAAHLTLGEVLSGAVDGVNTTFTTASNVVGNSIDVYLNGMLQKFGTDYTFNAPNTIVFAVAPEAGMQPPVADYIK